jgi:hypothetical protein
MTGSIIWAGAFLLATVTICAALLNAWRGWLDLKRAELSAKPVREEAPELTTAARIEFAGLKERLRKLEAIARGVDL